MNLKRLQTVIVSKAGNKEGTTAPIPWSNTWYCGARNRSWTNVHCVSLLMLQFLPFEWIPVSLTPACSANANQYGVGCYSGNLLVMACAVKYGGEGRTLGGEKNLSFQVVQQPARGQILLEDF